MNSRKTTKKAQTKSNVIFEKLKSDYFLARIFEYMPKKKSLEIMKINKRLQKRTNLSIINYKEYSELYSSIEIELTPAKNEYGSFIRISAEEKDYYHVYFNNAKKEKGRNFLKEKEKVKIIKIKIDHQVKSFNELFSHCNCISSINFKKFYRINITDMSGMFRACFSLKELNLSNVKTNNVTDMNSMFSGCLSLKELNIFNFITDNVIDMKSLFYECSLLGILVNE